MEDITLCLDGSLLERNKRESFLLQQLENEMHTGKEVIATYHSVLTEETVKLPLIIRKALAFKQALTEMPVAIKEQELIVGIVAKSSVGKGSLFPEYATEAEKEKAKQKYVSPFSIWGHYVPGHTRILKNGLKGIEAQALRCLQSLKGHDRKDQEKRDFCQAVVICCNGVVALAHRYATLAADLAVREKDEKRKAELEKISRICSRVPERRPETFHEALQSFWFVHLTFHSTLNLVPVGRFDQYLFPFLQKDLQNGTLSAREAQELIDCIWFKFNERYRDRILVEDFLDPYAFHLGGMQVKLDKGILHQLWMQNMILAGQTPQGTDATNLLTYLCLNATQKYELSNPTVTVRFFRGSPPELLEKTCQIIQLGSGQPTVYNDEVIVPAIERTGVPIEEARDYANDGCWETLIPGKTEFRYHLINSALCMDLALNKGWCRKCGKKEGIDTSDPLGFSSFAQVMEAYKRQLDHQIETLMALVVDYYGCLNEIAPVPFISATVDDCLKEGLDITQGGAKYIVHALLLLGLSHAIDSLAAVKKLVYEEGLVELKELLVALDTNFEGREDLRQILITRGPKYGNDDDYSDDVAKELLGYFAQRVKEHAEAYRASKIRFVTGVGTFEWFMMGGNMVAALPDGRLSGEGVSSNFSPSLGSALEGPTATVNSFTKMNFLDLPSGSPLDLSLDKKAFAGPEGLGRLISFVKTFMEKGGNMLTISVNSVEDFRRAQLEPEKYRHLRVRVGGWQAYFVDLTKEHQDHQIARLLLYA